MQDATYKKRLHTKRIVAIIVMAVLFALFTVGTVMFFSIRFRATVQRVGQPTYGNLLATV